MKHQKIKSVEDFINEDLPLLDRKLAGRELARQQVRSLDSICANMEEGYGRKAGKELKHFFRISRGSTGESKGRYKRCKRFLSEKTIEKRLKQLDEVQAMLHSLISKLRD